MRWVLLVGAACLSFAQLANAQPTLDQVIHKCESCHGPGGNSTSDKIPRLNGQQAQYLRARLFELRDPTRGSGHSIDMMFDNATNISDAMIVKLAQYFASQPPTSSVPHGPNAQEGKNIFEHGGSNGVPACVSCHGPNAEGNAAVPRLAGQHKAYLVAQLEALMLTARTSETMNHQAYHLSDGQMNAVAAYLGKD